MRYEIKNQPFTVLTLHMEQGESIKCQSGAMAWMSPGIQMETRTGGLGGMFKKEYSAVLFYFIGNCSAISYSKKALRGMRTRA